MTSDRVGSRRSIQAVGRRLLSGLPALASRILKCTVASVPSRNSLVAPPESGVRLNSSEIPSCEYFCGPVEEAAMVLARVWSWPRTCGTIVTRRKMIRIEGLRCILN